MTKPELDKLEELVELALRWVRKKHPVTPGGRDGTLDIRETAYVEEDDLPRVAGLVKPAHNVIVICLDWRARRSDPDVGFGTPLDLARIVFHEWAHLLQHDLFPCGGVLDDDHHHREIELGVERWARSVLWEFLDENWNEVMNLVGKMRI